MMGRIIGLLSILLMHFDFMCQNKDLIQQRMEFLAQNNEIEDLDLTGLVETWDYFLEHPININQDETKDLEQLQLLSALQINDVSVHLSSFGKFISIYELQTLPHWNLELIEMMKPFIHIDEKLNTAHFSFNEVFSYGRWEVLTRYQQILERKSGYLDQTNSINSSYQGNAAHYLTRFKFNYRNNLSFGLTAEKDPGEAFFRLSQKQGFDFYAFHLFYSGGKYLKTIALGDYTLQLGQGLNLWSGYAFGKGADVLAIKRTEFNLKPYTSIDEQQFLRGGCVQLAYKNWHWTNFFSKKKVDARLSLDSTLTEYEYFTAVHQSGLHRNMNEIKAKDQIEEVIFGSNLRFHHKYFNLGFTATNQNYSHEMNQYKVSYNQFDFSGKNLSAISMDLNYSFKNIYLFSELSRSSYLNSFAGIGGLIAALDPKLSLSVLYRNFGRSYHTFYNNSFSESGTTKNEKGLYCGLQWKLNNKWSVNSSFDVFEFQWMRYLVSAPSKGYEFLIQPTFKPSKHMEIYGRFRMQIKEKDARNNDGSIVELEEVQNLNARFNFSYKLNEDFTIRSRAEWVRVARPSNTTENGFLMSQDLIYNSKNKPFDLSFRYALFDTDSYDSRIYIYENHILNVFSIPAYYHKGSKCYFMLRYTFFKCLDLWLRYGIFIYDHRQVIGSGTEEIIGNRKSDVSIQLRLKF